MIKAEQLRVPFIADGDLAIDDRSDIAFVNNFHLENIKLFYIMSSHCTGFVHAWHAHHYETKYITVAQGAAIIAAVAIDNWEQPSKNVGIYRYILSAQKPTVLYIPPGYANGFMTLMTNTKLIHFSTSTLEESHNDEIHYEARYWDAWQMSER
jgi:dTDP-4-dehydrorhamnose 3,5-epimerase-like enzyme